VADALRPPLLPEYNAARVTTDNNFIGLATKVESAAEVTLHPLDRYALATAGPALRHLHRARPDGPGPELRSRVDGGCARSTLSYRHQAEKG